MQRTVLALRGPVHSPKYGTYNSEISPDLYNNANFYAYLQSSIKPDSILLIV